MINVVLELFSTLYCNLRYSCACLCLETCVLWWDVAMGISGDRDQQLYFIKKGLDGLICFLYSTFWRAFHCHSFPPFVRSFLINSFICPDLFAFRSFHCTFFHLSWFLFLSFIPLWSVHFLFHSWLFAQRYGLSRSVSVRCVVTAVASAYATACVGPGRAPLSGSLGLEQAGISASYES